MSRKDIRVKSDIKIHEKPCETKKAMLYKSTTAHFSVEPSNEKDYDIYLMTGNNGKGSEKK